LWPLTHEYIGISQHLADISLGEERESISRSCRSEMLDEGEVEEPQIKEATESSIGSSRDGAWRSAGPSWKKSWPNSHPGYIIGLLERPGQSTASVRSAPASKRRSRLRGGANAETSAARIAWNDNPIDTDVAGMAPSLTGKIE
jgi:hypothetical protein